MTPNVYPSIEAFRAVNHSGPKWEALEEALRRAEADPKPWARAVTATLTYWTEPAAESNLVNSRMYQTVIAAETDGVAVTVAPIRQLTEAGPYSDLSDSQEFTGTGRTVILAAHEILAVGPDEAWGYHRLSIPSASAHRARVSLVGDLPHRCLEVSA